MLKHMMVLSLSFTFLAALAPAHAFASEKMFTKIPESVKCDWYFSSYVHKSVHYCTHRSRPDLPQKSGEPVVYFFHSLTGSSKTWVTHGYADALDTLRGKEIFPAITFVTFDTGILSMFSDFGGDTKGPYAYESWFIKDFVPMIEDKLDVCRVRECKALAGLSMGGYGALKTAIKYWDQFFMAAANSPVLAPFELWNPMTDWIDYFNRHQVGALKGVPLILEVRRIFPSQSLANHNEPSWLVDAFGDMTALPKLYFDMGGHDDFGFNEGYHKFVEVLDRRGAKYTTEYVPDADHNLFKTNRFKLIRFIKDSFLKQNL